MAFDDLALLAAQVVIQGTQLMAQFQRQQRELLCLMQTHNTQQHQLLEVLRGLDLWEQDLE